MGIPRTFPGIVTPLRPVGVPRGGFGGAARSVCPERGDCWGTQVGAPVPPRAAAGPEGRRAASSWVAAAGAGLGGRASREGAAAAWDAASLLGRAPLGREVVLDIAGVRRDGSDRGGRKRPHKYLGAQPLGGLMPEGRADATEHQVADRAFIFTKHLRVLVMAVEDEPQAMEEWLVLKLVERVATDPERLAERAELRARLRAREDLRPRVAEARVSLRVPLRLIPDLLDLVRPLPQIDLAVAVERLEGPVQRAPGAFTMPMDVVRVASVVDAVGARAVPRDACGVREPEDRGPVEGPFARRAVVILPHRVGVALRVEPDLVEGDRAAGTEHARSAR